MLTLFPRIKPNPLPPAAAPAQPLEAKPVLLETVIAPTRPADPARDALRCEETDTVISPADAPPAVATEAAGPVSSVTDSDLFAAFMSGMATGSSDPFIVEISVQPSSRGARSESNLQALESASSMPERPAAAPSPAQSQGAQERSVDSAAGASPASQTSGDGFPAPQLYIAAANIFDELDILHEAATTPAEPTALARREAAPEPQRASESAGSAVSEAAPEASPEGTIANAPGVPVPASEPRVLDTIAPLKAVPGGGETAADGIRLTAGTPNHGEGVSAMDALEPGACSIQTASSEDAPAEEVHEPPTLPQERQLDPPGGVKSSQAPQATAQVAQERQETAVIVRSMTEPTKKAGAQLSHPKPKRAKGSLMGLARVPEPEAMEDADEVEAYSSAAAQSHLDAIDDTFVAHAQLLLKGRERGRALDIGTGPGQIVIKLGYRLSLWKFIGIDRSATMVKKAGESLATAGELAGRVEFRVADGNALEFPDQTFDLVVCNSVLHHMAAPQKLFSEIGRVVKPGGAILLRDLRRPSRWGYSYHVWKHGRHYSGEMRRLFMASVMAAYTEEELQKMVARSVLRDVRVFRHGKTHIGFERPIPTASERKR